MTNDKSYNGWTNYETWCVNLWLENEEGTYHLCREMAEETDEEDLDELARSIQDMVEDDQPEVTGLYADLIGAALSEVDWQEIAQSWWDGAHEDDEESEVAAVKERSKQ